MLALAPTPIRLEIRNNSKGQGIATVTNQSPRPITAYLLQVFLEPCGPFQQQAAYRLFDSTIAGEPIGQGQSHSENIGGSFCNKDGASVPAKAEWKAAIFHDGSFIGEPSAVEILRANRRSHIEKVDAVLTILKANRNLPIAAITAHLKQQLETMDTQNTAQITPLLDLYELSIANLKNGVGPAISAFESLRARIINARP